LSGATEFPRYGVMKYEKKLFGGWKREVIASGGDFVRLLNGAVEWLSTESSALEVPLKMFELRSASGEGNDILSIAPFARVPILEMVGESNPDPLWVVHSGGGLIVVYVQSAWHKGNPNRMLDWARQVSDPQMILPSRQEVRKIWPDDAAGPVTFFPRGQGGVVVGFCRGDGFNFGAVR